MEDETRRVLAKAKGLVSNGWFQMGGKTVGTGKRHCALLAVLKVTGDTAAFNVASKALAAGLGEADECAVFAWNDAPERTHAEVIALFDKVLTETATPVEKRELVTA